MRRRPYSTQIARWWWLSTLMALLVVGSVSGLALAQETSDEGTMQVVVLPPGGDLQNPTTESAGSETSRPFGYAPATVTARLAAGAELSLDDGSLAASRLLMTIFDERGTAYGWQVTLNAPALVEGRQPPSLLANRNDTIVMILPISTNQVDVVGQRVLGPLDSPLPLLFAARGSGAGAYTQRLLVAYDGLPTHATAPLLVGLPSAP
jgi:hypothetical protein